MQSYQLFINITQFIKIKIGKLGFFTFPRGIYVYTGSAKKNIDSRIERHLSRHKNFHWHIDYLLANDKSKIIKVTKSKVSECDLNAEVKGKIIVKGFGSTDCKENCGSHLKYIGDY